MIIEIEDKIVSTELFEVKFCCNLEACQGSCCVEGNAGAPLELEEIEILEREYGKYKPFLKPGGRKAIEKEGFFVVDQEGDLTTPLIDQAECAYACEKDGITFCAIEKAYRQGKISFQKPISCHLYPIRISRFGNGTTGMMFHRWSVCGAALELGEKFGTPVYRMLKDPIVRRFGEPFYRALEEAEKALNPIDSPSV